MNKVMFMGEECTIEFQKYAEGGIAMQLWCEDGPMGKATVCVPGFPLESNQVLIKDWSENEGMLKALVDAGIVRDTGMVAPAGYAEANVCELLVKPE